MNALDCPACGGQLQPHVGSPESAPWLCNVNRLQFWDCELAPEFRVHYRPHLQDWGYGVHVKELRLAKASWSAIDQLALLRFLLLMAMDMSM